MPLDHGLQLLEQFGGPSDGQIFSLDVDSIVAAGNGHAQRLANAAEMLVPRSEQSQERLGFGNRYRGFSHSRMQRPHTLGQPPQNEGEQNTLTIPNSWRNRLARRVGSSHNRLCRLHLRLFSAIAFRRGATPRAAKGGTGRATKHSAAFSRAHAGKMGLASEQPK